MAILSFRRYAEMPEPERLRRIGELLATAVIHYERDERFAASIHRKTEARRASTGEPADSIEDETEKNIVRYVTRAGAATPRDLCLALGLGRMTITRKLARLREAGVLAATGKTRAMCYRLHPALDANVPGV